MSSCKICEIFKNTFFYRTPPMAAHGSCSSPIFLVSNPLSIQSFADIGMHLTHFLPPISFLYPLKTLENLWYSDVFRGYQKGSVGWNGLITSGLFLFGKSELDGLVAYPGFNLGTTLFTKQNVAGSLGYGVRPPGKSFIFTFRESLKHAEVFLGLIASSVKMFRKRQNI